MQGSFVYCPICASDLKAIKEDGLDRLVCVSDDCTFIHYGNPLPVVAALVEYEGHVVLVRNKGWPDTWFGLVTGYLERGEKPEEGVLRELKEELNLNGTIDSLIGVYSFIRQNEVIIAYHVKATGTIVLGDELADVKHVIPEEIKPWPFGTGEAVRDWLKQRQLL